MNLDRLVAFELFVITDKYSHEVSYYFSHTITMDMPYHRFALNTLAHLFLYLDRQMCVTRCSTQTLRNYDFGAFSMGSILLLSVS